MAVRGRKVLRQKERRRVYPRKSRRHPQREHPQTFFARCRRDNASFGLLRRLDVSQNGVQRVQNHPQHDGPRVAAMQIPANLIQINTVTLGRRSFLHM